MYVSVQPYALMLDIPSSDSRTWEYSGALASSLEKRCKQCGLISSGKGSYILKKAELPRSSEIEPLQEVDGDTKEWHHGGGVADRYDRKGCN